MGISNSCVLSVTPICFNMDVKTGSGTSLTCLARYGVCLNQALELWWDHFQLKASGSARKGWYGKHSGFSRILVKILRFRHKAGKWVQLVKVMILERLASAYFLNKRGSIWNNGVVRKAVGTRPGNVILKKSRHKAGGIDSTRARAGDHFRQ